MTIKEIKKPVFFILVAIFLLAFGVIHLLRVTGYIREPEKVKFIDPHFCNFDKSPNLEKAFFVGDTICVCGKIKTTDPDFEGYVYINIYEDEIVKTEEVYKFTHYTVNHETEKIPIDLELPPGKYSVLLGLGRDIIFTENFSVLDP